MYITFRGIQRQQYILESTFNMLLYTLIRGDVIFSYIKKIKKNICVFFNIIAVKNVSKY